MNLFRPSLKKKSFGVVCLTERLTNVAGIHKKNSSQLVCNVCVAIISNFYPNALNQIKKTKLAASVSDVELNHNRLVVIDTKLILASQSRFFTNRI